MKTALLIAALLVFTFSVTLPAMAADILTGGGVEQMQAKPAEPAEPFE
jgi:hypothetical protein